MNFFLDLFASLSYFLFPFLVGRGVLSLAKKEKDALSSFAVGGLITFLFYFLSSLFLPVGYWVYSLWFIFSLSLALSLRNTSISGIKWLITSIKWKIVYPQVAVAVFTSLIYFFVWKGQTPYPLSVNWDIYEHITLANQISTGNFSPIPSQISDTFTFNGYTSIFHTLLSIPKTLFGASLLGVYWFLEYWHYLAIGLIVYEASKHLFNDKRVAVLSSLISSLVFESSIVYTNLFFIPQTLAATLTIAVVLQLLKSGKINKLAFVLVLLFILMNHFVIGTLSVGVVLGFLLLTKTRLAKYKTPILTLSGVTLLVSILSNFGGAIVLTSREEASYFALTLQKKMQLLYEWYGLSLLTLLPLGIFAVIKEKNTKFNVILVLALVTTAIALAPFSYFLKFYSLARYFVHFILVSGVVYLLGNIRGIYFGAASSLIVIAFFTVFYLNQLTYKNPLHFEDKHSHVSEKELQAGLWLKHSYSKDTMIISDPSTQYVLEAISGLNSQGGAYTSLETRSALEALKVAQDTETSRDLLLSVHDQIPEVSASRVLFVVSGRYLEWQTYTPEWKRSFYYNVWRPHKLDLNKINYVNFLSGDPRFRIVYQDNEMVVFEII